MTRATSTTRETAAVYRGRPLIVTVTPRYLEIHEKGRRDTVSMDYAAIYEMAMKMRWRREQAERNGRKRR